MGVIVNAIPMFMVTNFVRNFIAQRARLPSLLELKFVLLSLSFVVFCCVCLPGEGGRKVARAWSHSMYRASFQ